MKLAPHHSKYPRSVNQLAEPPVLTLSGPLDTTRRAVAIVGSRSAKIETVGFVHLLAYHLAKAGVVVVSGGAVGVDAAAHQGALKAGGTTWCVACTGQGAIFPNANAELFERIEQSSSSRMIWPFADATPKSEGTPRQRNGVLVALSECVIVVQAALQSGSRNAIGWARHLRRRLVIAPGMPWDPAFAGSLAECLTGNVDVLWSIEHLFQSLNLSTPDLHDTEALLNGVRPLSIQPRRVRRRGRSVFTEAPLFPVETSTWTEEEKLIFSQLSVAPTHRDVIIEKTRLATSSTLTALLTLSLKDVVVEGPDGFFRRRTAL